MNAQVLMAIWYRVPGPDWVIKVHSQNGLSITRIYNDIGRGISSNVRCQQTPAGSGKLLGHLGVKGEIMHCVPLYSARVKEA